MTRDIRLANIGGNYTCLAIGTGKRTTRIFLTDEQAQHLSNRLQAFAKGHRGVETVCEEEEPS